LENFWVAFCGCSQQNVPLSILWDILDTWLNQRSWDFSLRRSGSTFRTLRMLQLHTLSRSVMLYSPLRPLYV